MSSHLDIFTLVTVALPIKQILYDIAEIYMIKNKIYSVQESLIVLI